MKKRIKIIGKVQSYQKGSIYRVSRHFADKLITRGKAEEVITQKEEKQVIETKEEKHQPAETKDAIEAKDYPLSIPKLRLKIQQLTEDELLDIVKYDSRKGARETAEEEIMRRG